MTKMCFLLHFYNIILIIESTDYNILLFISVVF